MGSEKKKVLVEANHLVKIFKTNGGMVQAVSDVSLKIYEGETLALVGESGCGKSTLGRLLLQLIKATSGEVIFDGKNLMNMKRSELREARSDMQIVFQDPFSSLDPQFTVRKIVAEPLRAHHVYKNKEEERVYIEDLLEKVGIQKDQAERHPHEFSGGQRQRICIARALSVNPKFVVCDEPVSALDVSIQAQMLNLLHDLQDEFSLTYLFISHDLGVVHYISDRVCVMFLGCICEIGETEDIFENPLHPYTYYLLSATPTPDPTKRREDKDLLEGEAPSPMRPPSGCRFRTRCPRAMERCAQEKPELRDINGRLVACHFPMNQ